VPLFAVSRDRVVIWENAAAREITGGMRSQLYLRALAPESRPQIERDFAQSLLSSGAPEDREIAMLRPDGSRLRVEMSSAPVEVDGYIMGFFGAIRPTGAAGSVAMRPSVDLTPRQAEVLQLLARGASTRQIEEELGVSRDTARNHIRALLRRLGARSRLEAVVLASEKGLL
jgi:DNA-binding CsgD family transcriptional regulator